MLKKDSLIKGTLILAAAALVARFLGIFQKVPLDYIMGAEGNYFFSTANQIYLWLLIIATAGIPSTISKMISERYAQGRISEGQQIYRAALLFGAGTGIILSSLMFLFAPIIGEAFAKYPGITPSIQAIAPALLLFPTIAMMRGYFQGRQMMSAGGISQIIEQILRVVTGIGLALIGLSIGYSDERLAALATVGGVFGSVGAFLVMIWYAMKLRKQDQAEQQAGGAVRAQPTEGQDTSSKLKYRTIYSEIFRVSLPIVLTAMTVQFLYMVDSMFFARLTGAFYSTPKEGLDAAAWFGMRAQSIAGIPPILAIALSTSIIPVISAAYAVRNMQEVMQKASLVLRIVVFTGVPVALYLVVSSLSVTGALYSDARGSGIVAALTAGTIFQITMMTTNSILFGLGRQNAPMVHTLIGIGLKIVASLVLGPLLGVYGLIIASSICFIVISSLNLRTIRSILPIRILGNRWLPYGLVLACIAAIGLLINWAGLYLLELMPDKLAYLITAAVTGVAVSGMYMVLLILFRAVTAADIASFPGPLRKVFQPLLRLVGGRRSGQA